MVSSGLVLFPASFLFSFGRFLHLFLLARLRPNLFRLAGVPFLSGTLCLFRREHFLVHMDCFKLASSRRGAKMILLNTKSQSCQPSVLEF